MKKIIVLSSIIASVAAMNMAHAAGGTINFTGNILDATCNSTVSDSGSVTLPDVGPNDFTGLTAGKKAFTITLSDCTGTALNTVSTYFGESGTTPVDAAGNLLNQGEALNVTLQLSDTNGAIKIGDRATQRVTSVYATPESGAATLNYNVEYYKTGTPTPGSVVGSVVYSLDYK